MSVESFKRAFQKAFQSDAKNYEVRRAKCKAAIDELQDAVTHLRSHGAPAQQLDTYAGILAALNAELEQADAKARKKPGDAFKALDDLKQRARESAVNAAKVVKQVPMTARASDGRSSAKVFPNDVPGFAKMSQKEREEVVQQIAEKVGRGGDLMAQVRKNPKFIKMWAPTQEDVSDLMWFLKSRAQEHLGEAYERGAMTLPDPDGNLQALLDKCSEAYVRDSSHLKDQQKREGGQARGIDFYEGMSDGKIADLAKLLPSGMRTVLYQKMTTAQGDQRLYVKMETESARIRAKFWNPSEFAREEVQSRPREFKDWGRSVLHLGNLIKAKLGLHQGEDKDLRGFREKLPGAVTSHIEAAKKEAKKTKNQDVIDALAGLEKAAKGGVTQIWAHFEAMSELQMDTAVYEHLAAMAQAIFDIAPDVDADKRIGEEVVLDLEDLEAKPVQAPTPFLPNDLSERVVLVRSIGDVKQRWDACVELLGEMDPRDRLRPEVEDIQAAAMLEWGRQQAIDAYALQMQNIADDGDERNPGLNPGGQQAFVNLQGRDEIFAPGRIDGLVQKYVDQGIGEADAIAISTYTSESYKHINPAVANQKDKADKPTDWMDNTNKPVQQGGESNSDFQKRLKRYEEGKAQEKHSRKGLYEEGSIHAAMLMEALKKLPAKSGKVWRGERLVPGAVAQKYKKGDTYAYEAFASLSTRESVARDFASRSDNAAATVSVVCEIDIKLARDVRDFSVFPTEDEWLVTPGTVLEIVDILDDTEQVAGSPRATEWKRVKLVQKLA